MRGRSQNCARPGLSCRRRTSTVRTNSPGQIVDPSQGSNCSGAASGGRSVPAMAEVSGAAWNRGAQDDGGSVVVRERRFDEFDGAPGTDDAHVDVDVVQGEGAFHRRGCAESRRAQALEVGGHGRIVGRCHSSSRSTSRNAPIAIIAIPDTRSTIRAATGRELSSASAP